MKTYRVGSLRELAALLPRHQNDREKRILGAIEATAKVGASIVKRRVPVALGELRESVHVQGSLIVIDAPHAAPVETGSRPHTPPLAPLVAWIKLRSAQGLLSTRQVGRLPGTTTTDHARSVAAALRGMERNGALDVDAPVRIARAIQQAIAKRGTKPHWYARSSLPAIRALLNTLIKDALVHGP
jgi:hypothetical protein